MIAPRNFQVIFHYPRKSIFKFLVIVSITASQTSGRSDVVTSSNYKIVDHESSRSLILFNEYQADKVYVAAKHE